MLLTKWIRSNQKHWNTDKTPFTMQWTLS